MNKAVKLSMLVTTILALSAPAWAAWGLPTTMEGSVQNIENNSITLAPQSEAGNKMEPVNVEVNDKTEFEKLTSLDELNVGDKIQVQYKEEEGKKIATQISLSGEDAGSKPAKPDAVAPKAQVPEAQQSPDKASVPTGGQQSQSPSY